MVSTRQLEIACLALLVLAITTVISDADGYDAYTGVIAERKPGADQTLHGGSRLELVTTESTWDVAGHESELESLEGQPVTLVGVAQNGVIHVSAVYRPREVRHVH